MKHLKKKMRKRTVEAYICKTCHTPDDCVYGCNGDRIDLFSVAQAYGVLSQTKV